MAMLFGSLSTSGGENRLNVAVTRAREKIIVITSILPEQLNTQQSRNAGPKLLQEYLAYARNVSERKFKYNGFHDREPGTTYLSSRIKDWGQRRLGEFSFAEHVLPNADISILKENVHLGVVLTDDDRFNQSISIKDAFAYTPALLQRKNWGYRFVYSRQVWRDIEQLEQSLMLFIGSQQNSTVKKDK
jgi:hypothetical protein